MQVNYPNQDKTWESFLGLDDYEDFQKVASRIKFIKEVDEDVQKWFTLVKRLIVYSYFEYSFLDSALERAFIGFEFALRKKFSTSENLDIKKVNKRFGTLINWAGKQGLFEIDKKRVHSLRDIRNDLIHTNRHQMFGMLAFNAIESMVDLINDLFDDPVLRKQRKRIIREVNKNLKDISSIGFELLFNNRTRVVYDVELLHIDNKVKPTTYCFAFCPVFELPESDQNIQFEAPFFINSNNYLIEQESLIIKSKVARATVNALDKKKQEEVSSWYQKLNDTYPIILQSIEIRKGEYFNELRSRSFSGSQN